MSLNYLSCERPSGVMFGFVKTDVQPDSYDIYKIPAAKFLQILHAIGSGSKLPPNSAMLMAMTRFQSLSIMVFQTRKWNSRILLLVCSSEGK